MAELIDFATNDYLGLTRDPRIVDAACAAVRRWGAGAASSRVVRGTLGIHTELEAHLADFLGQPATLVCSTGYHANLAAVTTLGDPEAPVICDAHAHASLVDGARLSRRPLWFAGHHDVEDVEDLLRAAGRPGALVLVESVYSVHGDIAPIRELADICARFNALLLVDEAHALGVLGQHNSRDGVGVVADTGLAGAPHVLVSATLSKAFAAQGGLLAGPADVLDTIAKTARPFVYDTGLAPAAAGAALAVCRLLLDGSDLPAQVRAHATRLGALLGQPVPAAVCSLPMDSPEQAQAVVEALRGDGVDVGQFRAMSTPDGRPRLRWTAHASTTDDEWVVTERTWRRHRPA